MMSGAQNTVLSPHVKEISPEAYNTFLNLTNCYIHLANESTYQCLQQVPNHILLAAQETISSTIGS
jgi:hypothetical protein